MVEWNKKHYDKALLTDTYAYTACCYTVKYIYRASDVLFILKHPKIGVRMISDLYEKYSGWCHLKEHFSGSLNQ